MNKPKMTKQPLVSSELMSIIACPVCKADLKLVDLRAKKKEIDGKLICKNKKCGNEYDIKAGIPILLPPELKD